MTATAIDRHVDLAVVGGGIVGLCTAEAAQRRGLRVLCLEAGVPGAAESGGAGRILRHVHRDPRLVALTRRSVALWRALERRGGTRLLGTDGVLVVGDAAADAERLAEAGVDHDPRHPVDPRFRPGGGTALLDREGGALAAARAVAVLVAALGDRLAHERVHRVVDEGDDGAVLLGDRALIRARHAIVCAGAATPALAAQVGLDVPLTVAQHVRVAFRVRDATAPLRCLLDRSRAFGEHVYALPLPDTGLYAVGIEDQDPQAPATSIARTAAYVGAALPALDPEPAAIRTCHSSSLRTGPDDFAVWRRGAVSCFAGGNLFKHAPSVGEALVAEALGEEQRDVPVATAAAAGRT